MLFATMLPICPSDASVETTCARGKTRCKKFTTKWCSTMAVGLYKLDGVFSEAFPTHQAAMKAARRVAAEQHVPGDTRYIEYQTADGVWHTELAIGIDRPEADVSV